MGLQKDMEKQNRTYKNCVYYRYIDGIHLCINRRLERSLGKGPYWIYKVKEDNGVRRFTVDKNVQQRYDVSHWWAEYAYCREIKCLSKCNNSGCHTNLYDQYIDRIMEELDNR